MILRIDILEMNVITKYVSNKTDLEETEVVVELKRNNKLFVFNMPISSYSYLMVIHRLYRIIQLQFLVLDGNVR